MTDPHEADVTQLARLIAAYAPHDEPPAYQKVLRLQEAMLSTMMDARTAWQRVGYLSASQFDREYRACFGSAPTKDIVRLREDTRPAD